MSRSTCTYCGHDVGGHAGVKGCYEPSAAAHCSEFRRSMDDQAAQTRAAQARQFPPHESTPMGNHNIDCDFCGEDTRGLSGVRGCSTQAEADRCYAYEKTVRRQSERPAPARATSQQDPRPSAEHDGGSCPVAAPSDPLGRLVDDAELRRLEAAASPGDWVVEPTSRCILAPSTNPSIPGRDVVVSAAYSDRLGGEDKSNLEFIAYLVRGLRARLAAAGTAGDPVPRLEIRRSQDAERIEYLEACLATATRRAEAAEAQVKVLEGWSIDETEALDWLQETARKSRTGISFDWVPPGQGGPSGFRFMRRFFVGEICPDLRAAVRAARGGVAQAERDDPRPAPTREELLAELVRAARNQVEYFRRKQSCLLPLEAGDSEDGSERTPIGDYQAWEVGQANGRMGEAAWWLGVFETVQGGGSVPRNELPPDASARQEADLGEPCVPELQYHADSDAAEFYLTDDVAIYRSVDPFLSTTHSLTSGAMVGFRITDPRAWVRSILPPVEAETAPPTPVRPSREALEPLVSRIERIAKGWQGQNGGIFTIRAMAVAMARDLFADYQVQRPTSPPPEPTGQEPAPPAPPAPPALARAVEEALRTYDTQRLQFGATQETLDVVAPLLRARPDFVLSSGCGTTERTPLDEFGSATDGVPTLSDRTVAARLRDTALAQELRFLGDDRSRAVAEMLRSDIADAVYTRALALVRGSEEECWVTTGKSDWYRGGPRGYVLRQEWRNQFGVTEWRDVTDDELRAIERK